MYIPCPGRIYSGDSSSLIFYSIGLQKVAAIGFKEGRNREGDGGDAADSPIREKGYSLERELLQILIQYEKCARIVFIYDQFRRIITPPPTMQSNILPRIQMRYQPISLNLASYPLFVSLIEKYLWGPPSAFYSSYSSQNRVSLLLSSVLQRWAFPSWRLHWILHLLLIPLLRLLWCNLPRIFLQGYCWCHYWTRMNCRDYSESLDLDRKPSWQSLIWNGQPRFSTRQLISKSTSCRSFHHWCLAYWLEYISATALSIPKSCFLLLSMISSRGPITWM